MDSQQLQSSTDIHELMTQTQESPSFGGSWGQQPAVDHSGSVFNHSLFSSSPTGDMVSDASSPDEDVTLPASAHSSSASHSATTAVPYRPSLADTNSMPVQRAEKASDDPTAPVASRRQGSLRTASHSPITTLNQMFAGPSSRYSSYTRTSSGLGYTRSLTTDSAPLPNHLYQRGLLEGRHSDINVVVFSQTYALHRIILDRAPFFASALSEPWCEANQRTITLHPEDLDSNITRAAFELALKRLYGCSDPKTEQAEARALFATGCWLEMDDLVASSVAHILRHLDPQTIAPMIELVTTNYYGRAGEKVLSSAKARLCRDGSFMPVECWDGIPSDIIREIIGGDAFWVNSEIERFAIAKAITDRRLRSLAAEAGILNASMTKIPSAFRKTALRPTPPRRPSQSLVEQRAESVRSEDFEPSLDDIVALYAHPEIRPLLMLLDDGIHYCHMTFEQLQSIQLIQDALGFPVVAESILMQSLWTNTLLRQRIVNAEDGHDHLGLSLKAMPSEPASDSITSSMFGSLSAIAQRRKFWIPIADCNIIVGGDGEPVVTTSAGAVKNPSGAAEIHRKDDVQWFSDFMDERANASPNYGGDSRPIRYNAFPPFRFGAEFPNIKSLPAGKRIYSRTVVYAGSLWNVYIQRVKASSRNPQLGIYLHRAKERDSDLELRGQASPLKGSVNEHIGALEREILLRSEQRIRRRMNRLPQAVDQSAQRDLDSSESSAAENEDPSAPETVQLATASTRPSLLTSMRRSRKTVRHNPADQQQPSTAFETATSPQDTKYPNSNKHLNAETVPSSSSSRHQYPAMPSYVDMRPSIKTYFKIYTPSKGGRMLSVYESAPDDFKFSQSWGWKSSTLLMDEETNEEYLNDLDDEHGEGGEEKIPSVRGDGKLRCMVVLGLV